MNFSKYLGRTNLTFDKTDQIKNILLESFVIFKETLLLCSQFFFFLVYNI